ncbi:alpha/beta fold hydrolase [Actinomadura sp. DC4]|uniref:alpha/beta hydrolase n=1 Tax=Actinomadura sp. DC4 TaxID=3055069 RepID=UPI0025B26C0E|nr:alpha/beta fold hydrolase [Actinomadura sp. DC4]MDN3355696.1 alpha/beta fold hydrolase [Actinomadura sp. DC4]
MTRSVRVRQLALAFALVCGTLLALAMPVRAATTPTCSTYTLHVRIADPGPADQTLWGRLCYPGSTRPSKVQLLVHGSMYNHVYWDFPVGNGLYSYVKAAAGAGYATFNVDRIGDGNSSHPPSAQLDIPAGAVALHDVITKLRAGSLDGHAFSRVAWIGHSNGSYHAMYEISRYHDVDATILTGGLHGINPDAGSVIYPAVQDPKFAGSGLDSGYVTSIPGTRDFFYDPATSDPNVIAADEANKDVATLTASPVLPTPMDITVPVLLMSGQRDRAQCVNVTLYDCSDPASVKAYEGQFYKPEAHLTVEMIPGTGHDLALSTTAPQTDALMLAWLKTNFG